MKPLPSLPFDGAVDGDGHVLEPPDLWQRYLEPAFRDRAPTIRLDDLSNSMIRMIATNTLQLVDSSGVVRYQTA